MNTKPKSLGSLLRAMRLRNDWTLKQMSKRSGIALSTLSKIEHDRLTLTYDKLLLVSENLNIPMSKLLAEAEASSEPAITARRSIGTINSAVQISTPNYDYYYMCPELRNKQIVPLQVRVRAKSIEEFGELIRHSGEEYTHVVAGKTVLHTEFYDPITLTAGESVYIDSNMGHAYVCADDGEEALLLTICSGNDDEMHLRNSQLPHEEGMNQATIRKAQ